MKIVFLAHPAFLGSQSMPRFVKMLAEGMELRGHEIEIWQPEALFSAIPVNGLKKWLGYLDQYLVFPQKIKNRLRKKTGDVIYVVTDHALGPYVPLISSRPHAIHCHDFLAQRSAVGEIAENITSASGRKYQAYIRDGYLKGKNFISVSERTRTDLERFMGKKPFRSEMVYNGLNADFKLENVTACRKKLGDMLGLDLAKGYVLHVGGNQWYKNRVGVIAIYNKWRAQSRHKLPLILVGKQADNAMLKKINEDEYFADVCCIETPDDALVRLTYAGAAVFLFPSLAEGFGWPIAEAMASGTIVVTTNETPMLEVAGDAAFLIDRMPADKTGQLAWAEKSALVLERVLSLNEEERGQWVARGLKNVERFKLQGTMDNIERIYKEILNDNRLGNELHKDQAC